MKFEGKNNVNTTWNTIVCGVVFIIIINLLLFFFSFLHQGGLFILMSRFTFLFYFFPDFLLYYTTYSTKYYISLALARRDYTILQEEITE